MMNQTTSSTNFCQERYQIDIFPALANDSFLIIFAIFAWIISKFISARYVGSIQYRDGWEKNFLSS
jgi:hypothetical protein